MLTWAAHRVYGLIGLQIQSVSVFLRCKRFCVLWREHVVNLEEDGQMLDDLGCQTPAGQLWDLSKESCQITFFLYAKSRVLTA